MIAALLSLPMPGLGQLYNGFLHRALALFGVYVVILIVTDIAFSSSLPHTFAGVVLAFALLLAVLVIPIAAAVDAFVGARKAGEVALHPFNRWYVYVALLVLNAAAGWATDFLERKSFATYDIPTRSMLPTLQVGDHLVAAKGAYGHRMPNRGEMVLVFHPKRPKITFIRRVIGLPGDRVGIRNGRLYLNGVVVGRQRIDADPAVASAGGGTGDTTYIERLPNGASYRILEQSDDDPLDNTRVYMVPQDHLFVLGDNRDRTIDSRMMDQVGFIPVELLTNKPLYLHWSRDWGRIGTDIK